MTTTKEHNHARPGKLSVAEILEIFTATGRRPMKFTAYEAMGIQPLVAHSPLVSWMYDFLSVRDFARMLGVIEIATATLIALRSVSPKASVVGSVLAIGLFATTLSFLFSTPGWEPSLGFPALSASPGQFLIKDVVLFGASVWILGNP